MKQSVRTIGNTLHFDRVLHPQDCPMTTHRHVSYSSTWHPTVCHSHGLKTVRVMTACKAFPTCLNTTLVTTANTELCTRKPSEQVDRYRLYGVLAKGVGAGSWRSRDGGTAATQHPATCTTRSKDERTAAQNGISSRRQLCAGA